MIAVRQDREGTALPVRFAHRARSRSSGASRSSQETRQGYSRRPKSSLAFQSTPAERSFRGPREPMRSGGPLRLIRGYQPLGVESGSRPTCPGLSGFVRVRGSDFWRHFLIYQSHDKSGNPDTENRPCLSGLRAPGNKSCGEGATLHPQQRASHPQENESAPLDPVRSPPSRSTSPPPP